MGALDFVSRLLPRVPDRAGHIFSYPGAPIPELCALRPPLDAQMRLLPGFGSPNANKPPD
jgi:hypothetical protein